MIHKLIRPKIGSTVILVLVAVSLLIAVGLFFVNVAVDMNRARHLQNAVDAGVLNIVKQAAAEPSVSLKADVDEQQFKRIAQDDGGRIRLRNINRVWGRTLFVGMNGEGMLLSGLASDQVGSHVQSLFNGANKISSRLTSGLQDSSQMSSHFLRTAQENTPGLAGSTKIQVEKFQVSYVDRGAATQFYYGANQVPPIPAGHSYNVHAVPDPADPNRLRPKGYTRNALSAGDVFFVAFRPKTQSHLISAGNFLKNSDPRQGPLPFQWPTAVPNAFGVSSSAGAQDSVDYAAAAYGQSEFIGAEQPLAIADGYLRLENDTTLNLKPSRLVETLDLLMADPSLPKQRLRQIKPDFTGTLPELTAIVGGQGLPAGEKAYIAIFNAGGNLSMRLSGAIAGTHVAAVALEPPDGSPPGLLTLFPPGKVQQPMDVFFIPSTFYNQLGGVVKFVAK